MITTNFKEENIENSKTHKTVTVISLISHQHNGWQCADKQYH